MLKDNRTALYSAGGVLVVFVILVLANFILGAFKQRIDLTEGKIYTLSEGTRRVIAKLESPVKIRLYFSQSDASVPLALKAFGRRVEDMLGEFRQISDGKIVVAGWASDGGDFDFAIARFFANGTVESSFIEQRFGSSVDKAFAVAIQCFGTYRNAIALNPKNSKA